MSDGIHHFRIALAVDISLIGVALFFPSQFTAGVMVGGAVGVLVTPDVDHDKRTIEETRWYKIHPVVGKAYQSLWSVYPVLFRHRGLSHTPILGTLTRLIVLWFQLLSYSLAINHLTGWDTLGWWRFLQLIPSMTMIGIFCGWCFQDAIHYLTDIISTRRKRKY